MPSHTSLSIYELTVNPDEFSEMDMRARVAEMQDKGPDGANHRWLVKADLEDLLVLRGRPGVLRLTQVSPTD